MPFYQHGNIYKYNIPIADKSFAAIANTNRIALVTSAPENCIGIFSIASIWASASAHHYMKVEEIEKTDAVPVEANSQIHLYLQNQIVNYVDNIVVNSSRQIIYRGDSTDLYLSINCLGYIDPLI